jgi:hypothetical protein
MEIIPIPIGSNCLVAEHLKRLRVRRYSLPFDWAQGADYSSIVNVRHMLSENCKDFFNYSTEHQSPDINDGRPYTINHKYDLTFYHQNYMNLAQGDLWRNKLADALDKMFELLQHKKITFIYSSNYTEDIRNDMPIFLEEVNNFKDMCEAKRFNATLVILNTIKADATDEDRSNWRAMLDEYEEDTDFVTWRRLEIDDSDGVWGSSEAFNESLKGAIR